MGRPKGKSRERNRFDEKEAYIREQRAHGITIGQLARTLRIHPNTLSRYLKETSPDRPPL
ncbi:MAG: hypothetical protein J6M23_04065 [Bacteroidales bacterium]|nr:hypothetical protein [Bacteroidales bacterium]